MCGIVGIVGKYPVNQALYDGLTVLQHRGQDAAGIVTVDNNTLRLRKANGLVKDVFETRHMQRLAGKIGIGHVRYPTAGSSSTAEAQPFYVNSPFGIALAHNGNLTNAHELKDEIFRLARRHVNTTSDSEVLLNVLAHELAIQSSMQLDPEQIFKAIASVHRKVRGGYAAVALVIGHGLIAFRDPNGIRPLVIGKAETDKGTEYIVASESAALDILGFTRMRDVQPGEAIVITARGELFSEIVAEPQEHAPCIFEYVYFARPDSMIDNVSVHKARMRMGVKLGEKILRLRPDHDIDVPAEQARLAAAQLVVWLHPIQWYAMPALHKLWLDEVFAHGWAYGRGGGALRGKDLWLVTSTGGSEAAYHPSGYNRYFFDAFLPPYEQTAALAGLRGEQPPPSFRLTARRPPVPHPAPARAPRTASAPQAAGRTRCRA